MYRGESGHVGEEKEQAFFRRTQRYLDVGFDRRAAARFVAGLTPRSRGPVLDVGTGKGLLALSLAEHFPQVISVDVSTDDSALAILLAEEAGVRARISFLTCDASRLPFPDGHFGGIAMMDVLHHLKEGDPVLRELIRTLRPRGDLVVAEFTDEGFDLVARVHREDGGIHPVGPVTLERASAWLQEQGLVPGPESPGHLQRAIVFSQAGAPLSKRDQSPHPGES